jgi:hypothetical protein
MPATALATCQVYGTVFDAFGEPAADVKISVLGVYKDGALLLGNTREVTSDEAGFFEMPLPRDSTALIYANTFGFNLHCNGTPYYIPDVDTFELISPAPMPPWAFLSVTPPLYLDGTTLVIPRASAEQDGYISKEDYQMFLEGLPVGVTQIDTGTGLTGGPITDTGTVAMADVPGLIEGFYTNPTLYVNKQGQITQIESGVPPVPDSLPPVITLKPITGLAAQGAVINWDTDEPSDSKVEYSTNASFTPLLTQSSPSPQIHHSIPLTSLTPLTQYHFRVISKDASGNESAPVVGTPFTTLAGPDVTAPVIQGVITSTGITYNSATITWDTDESSTSVVEYGTSAPAYGSTATGPSGTHHVVSLSGLPANTPIHFHVKSADAATPPNTVTSPDQTFMTAVAPDTTPPVISNVRALSVLDTTATIAWDTGELSDSQVEYSTDNVTFTATPITDAIPPGPGVTAHSVGLTTLTANTQYYYRVKSNDAAGNPATPVAGTPFMTTGPSVPLLANLISYWKMDETGSSTVRADSKGSNPLTPTIVPSAPGKTGFNLCAQFTGTGDRLIAASNASLQTGPIDYSVAMWVQLASIAADHDFISKAGSGGAGDEYIIGYIAGSTPATTGRFRLTVQGGSIYSTLLADSFGVPTINTWYLIIAWHDQTAAKTYIQINGGPVDEFSPVPPLISGNDSLQVGCYGAAQANFLSGLVDEVAFFKAVLDSTQRAAIWNGSDGLPFDEWT